ncbi:MAG: DUF4093 domain-containing protein [Clostridiales bacterium]|jgi:ribonuclease M5|nr:DUF4093 domain-containing protein [Clostridiales bacterium]
MLKINEAIVVEGIYDKKKLRQVVDAVIITTNGFDIYSNKAKAVLLRRLARERGLIVLTDSDRAGFRIRGYIKSIISDGGTRVKHAYIPDVLGKERRKNQAGKDGLLGVEGMSADVLEKALTDAGCAVESSVAAREKITKADLYEHGLAGNKNSAVLRRELCRKLKLPVRISANALLEIINALYTRDAFFDECKTLF